LNPCLFVFLCHWRVRQSIRKMLKLTSEWAANDEAFEIIKSVGWQRPKDKTVEEDCKWQATTTPEKTKSISHGQTNGDKRWIVSKEQVLFRSIRSIEIAQINRQISIVRSMNWRKRHMNLTGGKVKCKQTRTRFVIVLRDCQWTVEQSDERSLERSFKVEIRRETLPLLQVNQNRKWTVQTLDEC
jgi:hypothetical protein